MGGSLTDKLSRPIREETVCRATGPFALLLGGDHTSAHHPHPHPHPHPHTHTESTTAKERKSARETEREGEREREKCTQSQIHTHTHTADEALVGGHEREGEVAYSPRRHLRSPVLSLVTTQSFDTRQPSGHTALSAGYTYAQLASRPQIG